MTKEEIDIKFSEYLRVLQTEQELLQYLQVLEE